ncbi:type II toxin-antitoxin system Phd/YefM family antitoxin [Streptomyces hainanensis]|uniref:Type II toxin-antitoxin system prevent-host-death family antitoxin n=1 Tax=Streptomyces hainanensis TaxID=402648 RepID=A0A4R4TDJ5_9ACTN|nr:type II toxin-antitoxin system prevent-host-death family antitoxin [Streptomyces hainanensis]TDC75551.1 type II toxin-antitoxin system prevent-host-death family antitoxin [Streptomyces hainanensis]
MRTMTATEVARNFASVLDRAEHGETIVITRGGRRLATLSPAPAGNGAAIKDFLAAHAVDEDYAGDVAAARDSVTDEMSTTWHDD